MPPCWQYGRHFFIFAVITRFRKRLSCHTSELAAMGEAKSSAISGRLPAAPPPLGAQYGRFILVAPTLRACYAATGLFTITPSPLHADYFASRPASI